MSNPNFRRWTSDDISILKKLAQTHPLAQIAARLGRSRLATSVKAHELRTLEDPTPNYRRVNPLHRPRTGRF